MHLNFFGISIYELWMLYSLFSMGNSYRNLDSIPKISGIFKKIYQNESKDHVQTNKSKIINNFLFVEIVEKKTTK